MINTPPWGESRDKAKRKEVLTGLHHEVSSFIYPLGQCRTVPRVFPGTLQIHEVSLPSPWGSQKLIKSLAILAVCSICLKNGTSMRRLPYFYKYNYSLYVSSFSKPVLYICWAIQA